MAKRRLQTTQTAQEEASTQLQTQGSSAPTDEQNVPDVPTPQHRRGTTQMSYIWNLSPEERIPVEFNSLIQPIKSGAGALHRFLGTMARRHNLLKINCTRWNEMDQAKKDECWNIVESKFLFPSDASVRGKVKVYVMKKLGDLWRNYKAELKAKYFNPSLRSRAIVAKAPPTVNTAQFKRLVKFWMSDEGKKRSRINKANREKQKEVSTIGSKSIAQYAHELVEKGKAPTRTSMYKVFRTKKDKTPVTTQAAEHMAQIDVLEEEQVNPELTASETPIWSPDDIFSQVMGKERHGRIRGVGFGPTPSMFGPSRNTSQNVTTVLVEELAGNKEMMRELLERVTALERERGQGPSEERNSNGAEDMIREEDFDCV